MGSTRGSVAEVPPQLEDGTRTQGDFSCKLAKLDAKVAEEGAKVQELLREMVKLSAKVAEEGAKVQELLREKGKFEVLKKKVGEMLKEEMLKTFEGLEEVRREVRDVRELRREVIEVKERTIDVEKVVASTSEESATIKVLLSDVAVLKEAVENMKGENADVGAMRAEIIQLKEAMREELKAGDRWRSQVGRLETTISTVGERVDWLFMLSKGNSTDNILESKSNCTNPEKKAQQQHTEREVADTDKDITAEREFESEEVEKKENGLKVPDDAIKTVAKSEVIRESGDVEEEKEIAPHKLVTVKPKLVRKIAQRK